MDDHGKNTSSWSRHDTAEQNCVEHLRKRQYCNLSEKLNASDLKSSVMEWKQAILHHSLNVESNSVESQGISTDFVSVPMESKHKILATLLSYFNTSNLPQLRHAIKNKLCMLICVDDRVEQLHKYFRMNITDWLAFDTLLVHENIEVIYMNNTTLKDPPALIALFGLVEKHNIESLEGDQLAEAWAALTLEYNTKGRNCTPMLLQLRWYQFKLAARARLYNYWSACVKSKNYKEPDKTCRPTPLQIAIIKRYANLALEPFMSWENRIKHKLVILRDQFEKIAMNKSKIGKTSSSTTVDLTSVVDEINSIQPEVCQNITNTIPENPVLFIDDSSYNVSQITRTDQAISAHNPDNNIDKFKENVCDIFPMDTMTQHSNDVTIIKDKKGAVDELNGYAKHRCETTVSDEQISFSEMTVAAEQEPSLPKITNIFGNVHVPVDVLSNISNVATQITSNYGINAVQTETDVNYSRNEQNIHINQNVPIVCADNADKSLTAGIDEIKPNEDVTKGQIVVDNKKAEDLFTVHKKLLMIPIVRTVKLDDMGVLPMRLLGHVTNKSIIDIISLKSKVTKNIGTGLKSNTDASRKKVEHSSLHYNRSRKRTYTCSQLSKNPDFNIPLKKLNRHFFTSDRNRMLLRSCKPLCVDVDKSFESKLVNGRIYLKPTSTHSDGSYEQIKLEDSNQSTSARRSALESLINNSTNTNDFSEKLLDLSTLNNLLCILDNGEEILFGNINEVQVSDVTKADNGTTLNTPETNKEIEKNVEFCCWAQAKLRTLKFQHSRPPQHNCPLPLCTCCCKSLLAVYYFYNLPIREKESHISTNIKLKRNSKKFHKPKNIGADVIKNSYTREDKLLYLGENKMLLTTTKIPKNFKEYTDFKRYVVETLNVKKGIQLLLKFNGQVLLKRESKVYVNSKTINKVAELVREFNRLSSTYTDNSLNENATISKVIKKVIVKMNDETKTVQSVVIQNEQNPLWKPLQETNKDPAFMNKIKSCLGSLFYKTLTPIKFVSELKYAYTQNGLFFKLDLDTGSLVPENVCIKTSKDCVPTSGTSSAPIEDKTLTPMETQSPTLLTSNSPKSTSCHFERSILSKSPEPISSTLPGQILCKPIESIITESPAPKYNNLWEMCTVSFASDGPSCTSLPYIIEPLNSHTNEIEDIPNSS